MNDTHIGGSVPDLAEDQPGGTAARPQDGMFCRNPNDYYRLRCLLIRQGRWQPHEHTAVAPVSEHVRTVLGSGRITITEYAGLAEVSADTIRTILARGCPTVRSETADKLYAVTVANAVSPGDATGPRRMLQALTVGGWTAQAVATRAGRDLSTILDIRAGRRARVTAGTATRITGVYRSLRYASPPETTRAERSAAAAARRYAERRGWAGVMAWDDDTISDPSAQPAEGWRRPPEKPKRGRELAAEATELITLGETNLDALAARLGTRPRTLERALSRSRRAACRSGTPATSPGGAA